jgi:predicted O-methyltransferase YrrM
VVARPLDDVVVALGERLSVDGPALIEDPALRAIEEELRERLSDAGEDAPFPVDFNASVALARVCWIATRGLGARTIVETGVAAGFTTSVILAALEAEGGGVLHSVDVPPQGVDPNDVGWLVPDRLRHRWTLHRGRSRRVLPRLLRELAALDVFVHDGLHTEATMRWELKVGGGAVRPGGVAALDDAERNPAFAEWADGGKAAWWALSETEFAGHHFGVAVIAG